MNIDYITPVLKTTSDSTILQLTFSSEYGRLFNLYYQKSNLSISTLNASVYGYTITQSSASVDIYYINLNYSVSVSNKPVLTLSLNPPDAVLYNTSTTLQLSTTKVQCTLNDYYVMDASTKSLVDATKSGTNTINSAAGDAFAANNFMMGSSFGVKSLVSMDTIRFLRYFTIDYPPNVLAMYQSSMPMSDLVPNVNINEDPADGSIPDIFNTYNMSTYCFNNNGNSLIEAMVYVSVGVFILQLLKISKKTRNHYFRVLCLIFRLVFVWNYAISYFLSQFMTFTLSTFLAFRYPSNVTPTGQANYFFAYVTLCLVFAVFGSCGYIIWKLRPMLMAKFLEKQQKEAQNAEKVSAIQLPHLGSNISARPLKGGDMSSTVFPDLQSPEPKGIDEVGEIRKELAKNNKSVTFNQTMDKTMDEIPEGGDVSPS